MNIPNSITIFRLILTALFIAATSLSNTWAHNLAMLTFILAAISDWLDGYLARRMNLVTSLGKLLDPLADKILVSAGFIYLSVNPNTYCPIWITCAIIGREFMVTGLRQIAVEQGSVIAADNLGKWKTTFQLIFIIGNLVHLSFSSMNTSNFFLQHIEKITSSDSYLIVFSLWIATFLTLLSGFNYIFKNRTLLYH